MFDGLFSFSHIERTIYHHSYIIDSLLGKKQQEHLFNDQQKDRCAWNCSFFSFEEYQDERLSDTSLTVSFPISLASPSIPIILYDRLVITNDTSSPYPSAHPILPPRHILPPKQRILHLHIGFCHALTVEEMGIVCIVGGMKIKAISCEMGKEVLHLTPRPLSQWIPTLKVCTVTHQ